ncbi:MAG: sulfite exporter TauE/SafE family protein [Spirochaetales bacterium]|nr:sulfite exporter TauE/SafE family protein [Spirochaetales bacterium]
MVVDGFILGLSTGMYCISSCAPVAFPFLLAQENGSARQNSLLVALFMAGRLVAYIVTGSLLGALGAYAAGYLDPGLTASFRRFSFLAAGLLMVLAGLLINFPAMKLCRVYGKIYRPGMNALAFGLLTGFSLCPPFFAAATRVFGQQSGLEGALYFLFFFLGTSVYFLPLFGISFFRKHRQIIQLVSRTALLLAGFYYVVFLGIIGV